MFLVVNEIQEKKAVTVNPSSLVTEIEAILSTLIRRFLLACFAENVDGSVHIMAIRSLLD